MKQIAILHYSAPPETGAVETILYHHIRLLQEAGYPLRVIAAQGEEAYYDTSFHHEVDFYSVPVMDPDRDSRDRTGQTQANNVVSPALNQGRDEIIARLEPLLAGVEVCIVHDALTDGRHPSLAAALNHFIQQGTMRFIAWCHSLSAGDQAGPSASLSPDVQYITTGEHLRVQLAARIGIDDQNILIVPAGIDQAKFLKWETATQELVKELDLYSAAPVLLLPGEFSAPDHLEFAVQVTSRLREAFPQATLIITENLDQSTPDASCPLPNQPAPGLDLPAAGYVHFLSEHSLAGLPLPASDAIQSDFYCLADLVLLPGAVETSRLPLLGAALMRLPVFAPNHFALPENTAGAFHYYPAGSDPEVVAGAISAYLAQDQAYASRQHVLRHLTWQVILERHLIPLIETSGGRPAIS